MTGLSGLNSSVPLNLSLSQVKYVSTDLPSDLKIIISLVGGVFETLPSQIPIKPPVAVPFIPHD